jgi:NAD-dependent SIR2 family protein deacetylase
MAQTAAVARPTQFHELLAMLNDHGKLLRVYTQNIDGLELKSGLSTASGCDGPNSTGDAVCIALHGGIHQLQCQSCGRAFSLDPYLATLMMGDLPPCDGCRSTRSTRAQLNLRDRKAIPALKPNIILYGEDHPRSEEIAQIIAKDVKVVDLLLVVGTSMKVDGIQHVIRPFAQAATHRAIKQTKKPASLQPRSIYLNTDFCNKKKWSDFFQCWVKGDCQAFSTMFLKEFEVNRSRNIGKGKKKMLEEMCMIDEEKGRDEDVPDGDTFEQKVYFANRRLDLRPLCRYF